MNALTVNFNSIIKLTDEQFFQLCQDNRDLRFERNANGELIIMPPTGGETGNRNAGLTAQVWIWNDQSKLGMVFDSSTGFKLPNGADRSPDAAWIPLERWNALTSEQQQKFLPLCPDFVVELLSPSDSLSATQQKMQEYMDNATRLGWLIVRASRRVEIYRQDQEVEILEFPVSLSGEDVLPGFVLNLESMW
ncbi:Uma2 family endonuclease [Planktothrix sp. FACHB-1355]|uniref:Uma2 family endonuclease n=1 Tax=Aerosakkonema funiforme FACHB-1375 TaxID=2949571 RepID=A0A926VHB4_9CYAN|nr:MULTISPECIES: Uma2 family endonuclease [Oscillatoriales]MBD2184001.1 Uma2 family endonuclease [Aerosakkonema funiforme FACHB-1375]MBD3557852.1 Uma2 family endonuclease [Planktothrix sp. FACHB-1355]